MLFGTGQKLANVTDFVLNQQRVNINRVTEFSYLGVVLDEQLLTKRRLSVYSIPLLNLFLVMWMLYGVSYPLNAIPVYSAYRIKQPVLLRNVIHQQRRSIN